MTTPSPRTGLLAKLAGALDSLTPRLSAQRDRLRAAATLGPKAEEAAIRARLLALGCGEAGDPRATALAADIGTLAADAAALAQEAERAAEAGQAHAGALAAHAAALATVAAGTADAAGLRDILTPLARTLETLAAQRQAQGEIGASLARLAARATPLATHAAQIADPPTEEALQLARDLGALAAEAGQIAADMARDPDAAASLSGQLRGLAAELPPIPPPKPPRTSFGRATRWGDATGGR